MKEEKEQCAHCKNGIGLKYVLNSSKNFWIVCDAHPLIEGHILNAINNRMLYKHTNLLFLMM